MQPASRPAERSDKRAAGAAAHSDSIRITYSSLAIVWSIILLIFFTFFYKYIAYYEPTTIDGASKWVRYPVLTGDYNNWLPILIATLFAYIIGHILLIYLNKYIVQAVIPVALNLLVIATVLSLLFIFPFNFTKIPNTEIASTLQALAKIGLIGVSVALGVGTLIRTIRLVVNLSLHKT